jgi:hypothetical protein
MASNLATGGWSRRIEERLNEDGSACTLVKGLYLLCNGIVLLLLLYLYYGQMIILHGNLLDCIYNKRRIKEKRIEEQWLNEGGAIHILIEGLHLLSNDLGLLLLYGTKARWSSCMWTSWIASALTTRGGSRRRRRSSRVWATPSMNLA